MVVQKTIRSLLLLINRLLLTSCCLILFQSFAMAGDEFGKIADTLIVNKISGFEITGDSVSTKWGKAAWVEIPQRNSQADRYTTKMKVLYSDTGLYFLFSCEDEKLTSTFDSDFLDLWNEDVVEVFLMPDPNDSGVYFEYEISPLNFELPILISNKNGDLTRWLPFHYDSDRKTTHATFIYGGEKKSFAKVNKWIAEFYIPFKLLRPLKNIAPKKGTTWRGNFYRIDYDDKPVKHWSWKPIKNTFHDYHNFGVIRFN